MKALLLVDLQYDFFPGGALEVKDGDKILPAVNKLLKLDWEVITASKDWHPSNHESFASMHEGRGVGDKIDLDGIEQILWPDHCVENTKGAEFYPGWDVDKVDKVFYKGVDPKIDSYSTFFDNGHLRSTGLGEYLKERNITEVCIAGLATDYCVKFSVFDALKLGFKTTVVMEGVKGVDLKPGDSDKALREMQERGAFLVSVDDL
jgi:nicotinamidase/pyrazinamidase